MDDFNEKFPIKEYKKQTWNLTKEEGYRLTTLDTISQNGKLAEVMLNSYLQGTCLKRVGVQNSQDVGIEYDLSQSSFVTYTPRILCDVCKVRKADYELPTDIPDVKQHLCGGCMKIIEKTKKAK
jgi:hypothetical protein